MLTIAAIDQNDYSAASDAFSDLRAEPYTTNRGSRGIELDNAEFGTIAEIRYHECGWEPFQIKSRLKHDEGWGHHDWM